MEQVERKHGNQLSILKIGKVFNDIEENTIDLRAIFQELNIYSNIDDMITTGDILISEQGNLIEKLPIEGTEYIEIEFCTLENEYDKYHRIFFVRAIEKLSELSINSFVYLCGRITVKATFFPHIKPRPPQEAVIVFILSLYLAVSNIQSFPILLNGFKVKLSILNSLKLFINTSSLNICIYVKIITYITRHINKIKI